MKETQVCPWVGEIPQRRKWQLTSVSLPGKSTDRGAWRATVHGVTESDTAEQLNDNNPFRRAGNKTDSVQSSPVQSPVMSDSVQPHRLQHTRLPCPSQVQELTQTHVHWVGDAIQPSHPLLSPFPPAFNLSQHQSLFQWVSSFHQVAKVLELQLQHQYFQWIFRTDFL